MAIELNVQGLAAVAALAEARAAEKAAKAAAAAAAEQIKALLGDDTEGTVAGVCVVEIKTVERHGLDAKALLADDPETYAKYDKVTEYQKINLA